ncbi:MAG: hypothetical protein IPP96_06685 [Chitinophagaceae bacterium]|nr:hypothetical protein [Chitinophagaceae bacterium]
MRDRSDAAGVPANAIYSSGTASPANTNNTISTSNIFNHTNAGVLVSATGAGNGWTIAQRYLQTAAPPPLPVFRCWVETAIVY